jgi:lysophospholipase L1-like esterase
MKIMPLGASITEGVGSTGGGYRLPLSKLLTDRGVAFQFVGSLAINTGTLAPDELHHEGHSGFVITAGTSGRAGITDSIETWLGPSGVDPDVVLLLVGTNDCDLDYKLSEAPARMDHLLTMILDKTSGLKPKARLILARLPPIADATEDARVVTYNDGIAAVAERHKAAGENVAVVDMHPVVAATDMFDKLHPKDSGYAKMAPVWLDAILAP